MSEDLGATDAPPMTDPRGSLYARGVRVYSHLEFPKYGQVLNRYGMNQQERWAAAPTVEVRGRFHRYWMKLDLADFFQRIAYFFGTYHELDVISAIDLVTRPGEHFIDAGANIGLVTLHAARRVGEQGQVDSFECNPVVLERLRWHVERNALSWVRVHEVGVSDEAGELDVILPGFDNQAAATLGALPQRYGSDYKALGRTPIVRIDEVVDADDPTPLTVKMDVEGFEAKALAGMTRLLERRRPTLIPEINSEMLELNGSSAEAIYDLLTGFGYRLFALDRGGFKARHRMKLHPLTRGQLRYEKDVMFIHPDGPHWGLAEPRIQPVGMFWRHHQYPHLAHLE